MTEDDRPALRTDFLGLFEDFIRLSALYDGEKNGIRHAYPLSLGYGFIEVALYT